jgi:hypothetical protein
METASVQDEIKNMFHAHYSNSASLLPVRRWYLPISAWLLIIFSLLVFLKSFWIYFYSTGPVVFGDEFLYKETAQKIFDRQPYDRTLYPPLYPMLLSVAFFSKEHWYEWMLFINTLLSSSIIFPAYLISKRLLPEKTFFLPVIMIALLPFHALYPSLLLSENLFLLVFLFALYFSLIREKRCWFSGMLVGVFCALAYMTKYLFLPSIPLLIGLWWLIPLIKKDLKGKSIWQKLQLPDLAAVTAGFLIIYTPWLLYAHYSGISIGEAMGLGLASSYGEAISGAEYHFSGVATEMPNLDSLVLWITAYSSYLVLVLAPLLGILYLYFSLLFSKKEDILFREKLFFFSLIALSIGYFFLAIQHSWGADYNYPVPQYLLGRYLMHLTPLYFIAAVVALYRLSNNISSLSYSSISIISLIALILVWAAQRVLFEQAVWKLPGCFACVSFNSPDSLIYSKRVALWAVLTIICLVGISLFAGRSNKNFNQRFMVRILAGLLIFFQFSVFCNICLSTMTHGVWMLHPRLLAPILNHDIDNGVASIALMYDIPDLGNDSFSHSLVFWGVPQNRFSALALGEKMQNIPDNAKQYFLSGTYYNNMYALYSYDVNDKKYYLYDTNWKNMRVPAPMLEDYGPRSTKAGRGFNIQPSGLSALWLRTRYATSATVVVFNGHALETTVGSEGFLAAVVPDNLFYKPGEYRIHLLDKAWGNKSNSVVFKVE